MFCSLWVFMAADSLGGLLIPHLLRLLGVKSDFPVFRSLLCDTGPQSWRAHGSQLLCV